MKNSWFAALVLVFTVACGNDDTGAGEGAGGKSNTGGAKGSGGSSTTCDDDETGSYPCDVGAIIEAKCQRCHTTKDAQAECIAASTCVPAPFSLLTFADTRNDYGGTPVYTHIARVVENGVMPMQYDGISPPVEPLTAAEKTTLIDWAQNCAPPGASACD